jgi:hypothetical protein
MLHLADIAEEEVRVRVLEFLERIVTGQHGAAHHSGVFRGVDVVNHVADENRFRRIEIVLGQQVEDDLALIERLHISVLEIFLHAEASALGLEMFLVDGAEQERRHLPRLEVVEKIERMGQHGDAGLEQLESGVIMVIKLGQRRLGQVLLIEIGEGEIELLAKVLRAEGGLAIMLEYLVGRLEDRIEIVDQRAGPVENDVADFGHEYYSSRRSRLVGNLRRTAKLSAA